MPYLNILENQTQSGGCTALCQPGSRSCSSTGRKQVSWWHLHRVLVWIGSSNKPKTAQLFVNRKRRDELSHNVFLMLQETNKFREHQAREILIEVLERQLDKRQSLFKKLEEGIERADELLGGGAQPMDES
jgi:hypothetical protein